MRHGRAADVKIVLSRKGFDSSAGRVPSPILPDGTLLPLPIPDRRSGVTYGEIDLTGWNLGEVVHDLTRGRIPSRYRAHLDPDLEPGALPRRLGWRPTLGQSGAAQGVLRRGGIGPGDLFLFFGWFRAAEVRDGHVRTVRGAPDLHVLFGWLEVGELLSLDEDRAPEWASDHPHVRWLRRTENTLYVGRSGGLFRRFRSELRLTAPGKSRSVWRLPEWFFPGSGRPPLGGHGRDLSRWIREEGATILRTAPRGQEFVLDADAYPEADPWARELIVRHSGDATSPLQEREEVSVDPDA